MSPKLQPVRGTHDILPEESLKRKQILEEMAYVCSLYNYREISTPIFEFSEVFHRTLGETSDVVNKETYTFEDRGGESLTLRPEFTAPVVRAFLSNGQQDKTPFKVYYHGPAFRYERPQKGRMRQFHQFGAELLGEAGPIGDIEMIAMAAQALATLGLNDSVRLELNSLGDNASRTAYRKQLVVYFNDHRNKLSEDSIRRLEKNPLRILDSKDEGDKAIIANAPDAKDYFTSEALDFFAQVQEALTATKISYTLNPRLVRGLDYYTHTVFEFTTDKLGAQGTVLAGGRYDGLVAQMGGPDIPGVGFASGIERLLALMETTQHDWWQEIPCFAVIPVDDAQQMEAIKLAQELRYAGLVVEVITHGNMSKRMKRAARLNALGVLVVGEDEVKNGKITLKYMLDGSQHAIARNKAADDIKEFLQKVAAHEL
ncbi:MAG: histidine--tRNA ligase [Alphaproteobacteria bacterium]